MMQDEPISTREDGVEGMLKEARERAKVGHAFWNDIYNQGAIDAEFAHGNQWPADIEKERKDDRRPMLTLNNLPQYLNQIKNDARRNRVNINVHSTRSASDEKIKSLENDNKEYSLAEVYEGLIRGIEYQSNAKAHYDRALGNATDNGIGWLRVFSEYPEDDPFNQSLRIKRLINPFAAIVDPTAQEPDYSDANWGFIFSKVPSKEFDKRYENAKAGDLQQTAVSDDLSIWIAEDYVVVAEYFTREPEDRTALKLSDGRIVYEDEVKDVLDEMKTKYGITILDTKKIKCRRVYWRKITAWDELETKRPWPGSTIPLVPVLGREVYIGEKRRYESAIHHAKDAQRTHNYWMTAATERVALAPKSPWLAPWKSIKAYFNKYWSTANRRNHDVLPYDEVPSGARPQRIDPPAMPVAEVNLALSMKDSIKSAIGIYDAGLGAQGNEVSGVAITARQRESDTGTFDIQDNQQMAIQRIGQILVDAIPHYYDGARIERILFENGSSDFVELNQTIMDDSQDPPVPVIVADLTKGKFSVSVKAGPAFSTQREELVNTLVSLIQAVPSIGGIIMDKLVENMDMFGVKDIAKRIKKSIPPQYLEPEELEDRPQLPPTPEQEVQKAQADADMAQAQADVATAEAKKMDAEAKIKEAEAKLKELDIMSQDGLVGMIRDVVAEALAELNS